MSCNIAFSHVSTTVLLLPSNLLKGCYVHLRYPDLLVCTDTTGSCSDSLLYHANKTFAKTNWFTCFSSHNMFGLISFSGGPRENWHNTQTKNNNNYWRTRMHTCSLMTSVLPTAMLLLEALDTY